ncbi:hypothetical protein B484DRAFT_396147 [Ochromonadaceae sp. CCMP2298]|nr:hypothetical protein B484DRAFT_396147 [Ochromonadaceae sp. CCMP2298]
MFEPARQEDILAAALTAEDVSLEDVEGMLVSFKAHDDNVISRSSITNGDLKLVLRAQDDAGVFDAVAFLAAIKRMVDYAPLPPNSPDCAPTPIVCEYSCDNTQCDFAAALQSANPTRFDPRAKAGFVLTPELILRNREKPAGPVIFISKAELHAFKGVGVTARGAFCVWLANRCYMSLYKNDFWREKLKQQGSVFKP